MTYLEWAELIKTNFEKCFWIPINSDDDDQEYIIDKHLVNRRGIYKDVFGSSEKHTDYQLRPNVCIAMSYAPELFTKENA